MKKNKIPTVKNYYVPPKNIRLVAKPEPVYGVKPVQRSPFDPKANNFWNLFEQENNDKS